MKKTDSMKWKCTSCYAVFDGPKDHAPKDGCAKCGSTAVFDINVEPVVLSQAAAQRLQIVPLQYLRRSRS